MKTRATRAQQVEQVAKAGATVGFAGGLMMSGAVFALLESSAIGLLIAGAGFGLGFIARRNMLTVFKALGD